MPGAFSDIDKFEDLLDILFSTSTREMAALILLSQHEQKELHSEGNEADKRLIEYWPRFRAEAIGRLAIPEAEFPGFMSRLERTSLYTSSLGMMWGSTGEGRTTPQFARIAALVLTDGDLKGAETSVL